MFVLLATTLCPFTSRWIFNLFTILAIVIDGDITVYIQVLEMFLFLLFRYACVKLLGHYEYIHIIKCLTNNDDEHPLPLSTGDLTQWYSTTDLHFQLFLLFILRYGLALLLRLASSLWSFCLSHPIQWHLYYRFILWITGVCHHAWLNIFFMCWLNIHVLSLMKYF